ncbi:hypothetical protein F2P81_021088 [Scophthalmus maximus]|uniref:Uncharacterized protein n=1 Tax=Scophthalmus maximus TaxID=52904 RepID=A0A6A4S5C8_SCOMX|nr:hypothetical protein F2P81_021088 [Scophthalmus maximus]
MCRGAGGALHCSLRTGHPPNSLSNRAVLARAAEEGGGDWTRTRTRTRSRSRSRRSTAVASFSPLSGNMSDFLLLAFLALFSGLCPRAERSTASDEEREFCRFNEFRRVIYRRCMSFEGVKELHIMHGMAMKNANDP